jgi:hypothetical protein
MALRLTSRSPWCTGLSSHHRLDDSSSTRLDPSVGGSGPHGLTVRGCSARLAAPPRPSHPAPRFVTTAKRLFGKRGMASLNHNFFLSERQIFWRRGLDIAPLFEQPRKCFARRVVEATLLRRQACTCSGYIPAAGSGSVEFLRALASQREPRSATRLLRCTCCNQCGAVLPESQSNRCKSDMG